LDRYPKAPESSHLVGKYQIEERMMKRRRKKKKEKKETKVLYLTTSSVMVLTLALLGQRQKLEVIGIMP